MTDGDADGSFDPLAAARVVAAEIAGARAFRVIPGLDPAAMDRAYAVQAALTGLRGGPRTIGGYKLAFNSQGSREYYGAPRIILV